jgi:uncharacterized protein (TIGR00369 family)
MVSYIENKKTDHVSSGQDIGGFHALLGYKIIDWGEKKAVIELEVRPEHLNMGGVIHGGVLTSLLDIVCTMAGTYCAKAGHVRKAITLSLTTTFTGQCSSGIVRAVGVKRAGGRRIFNCSGEVYDQEGRLLAMGEATCRLRSGSELPDGVPFISRKTDTD